MIVNIKGIKFNVQGRDNWWSKVQQGSWENHTYETLTKYLKPDKEYVDVGSWIGSTVLYGAQLSKYTYAIDADIEANKEFKANLNLNPKIGKKVTLIEKCLSDHNGEETFGSIKLGNSCSSIFEKDNQSIVDSTTLQEIFIKYGIENCNFIKMDVEGAESKIIPQVSEFLYSKNISIYLAFHVNNFPDKRFNAMQILQSLKEYKYIYDRKGGEITYDSLYDGVMKSCDKYNSYWASGEKVFTNEKH